MNINKFSVSTFAVLALVSSTMLLAQSATNQAVPLQRPGVIQQQGQVFQQQQQPTAPRYYNVTLTDAQKSQPSVGAAFYDTGSGMGVRSVYTNSPAQNAGINSGDLISKVNGQPISNVASYNAMVARMQPGASIRMTKKSRTTGKVSDVECKLMTVGEIINASVVPEAGVYESAALKARQMLKGMQQEIQNAESELVDMKKRYATQQQRLEDLLAKTKMERQKASQMQAAEEAKRQRQIEMMKKRAEDAARGN